MNSIFSDKTLPITAYISFMICMALLFGCAAKPSPTTDEVVEGALPEETVIPHAWTATDGYDQARVDDNWLATFNDPQLVKIVAEVLKNNLDLRTAAANVDVARALAVQAGAELTPAVGIGGGGERTDREGGLSTTTSGAALNVSWELDIWGRVRAQAEAGKAQFEAAQADYEFARQSLAAQAAKSWFLATETLQQRELAKRAVEIYQKTSELVQAKFEVGQVSKQDVFLAKADLSSAQERLRKAQGAHELAVRSLEVLLGRYPSADLAVAREFASVPPPVPAGLPSEILERRPDLIAAERRVAAAYQLVLEAKAAKLPRISLTAGAGTSSSELIDLVGAGNDFWNVGANFAAPIFAGGALEAQVEIATAQQEAALAQYGQTALRAFKEVETTLSNEKLFKEREDYLRAAFENNAGAHRMALVQYDVGRIDLLSVLQMQARVINSEIGIINIKNDRLALRVDFHLALGGSFEERKGEEQKGEEKKRVSD